MVIIQKAFFCKPSQVTFSFGCILIPKYNNVNSFIFQLIIKKISLPTPSLTMIIISSQKQLLIMLPMIKMWLNPIAFISQSSPFQQLLTLLSFPSFLKHSIFLVSRTTHSPGFPLLARANLSFFHLAIKCCSSSRFHPCPSLLSFLCSFQPQSISLIPKPSITLYRQMIPARSLLQATDQNIQLPATSHHSLNDSKASQDQNGKTYVMSILSTLPSKSTPLSGFPISVTDNIHSVVQTRSPEVMLDNSPSFVPHVQSMTK